MPTTTAPSTPALLAIVLHGTVSEAEDESDKLYKEALELANNEANASKEKARLEIESQTSAARDQLSKQADDLSELIVNRLILEK